MISVRAVAIGVAAILLGACAALSAGVAAASTFEWTNAVPGTYSDAANWHRTSGGTLAPPVAGDKANFNEAGAYTITFSANAASDILNVTAGNVSFGGTGAVRTYSLTTGISEATIGGATLNLGTSLSNPLNLTVGGALYVDYNATLNIKYGSVVDTSALYVGVYGGTSNSVLVDGAGLGASGGGYLGYNGFGGNLTYQNSSAGTWGGSLIMAESTGGGIGNLSVLSGSNITLGSISAATNGASGAAATITVIGSGSSITQSGNSTLTLGAASAASAALNISSNAVFTTGTGLTTANKTGTINVTTGATFIPRGDITVSGGAINVDSSSNFQWSDSRILTVNGGGRATFNKDFNTPTGATINISGAGSKIETTSGNSIRMAPDANVMVSAGGQILSAADIVVNSAGFGTATVTVDGVGSALTAVGNLNIAQGCTADVYLRNHATASAANVAVGIVHGCAGTLHVEGGASLTANTLAIASSTSGEPIGTLTVRGAFGAPSQVNLTGANPLLTLGSPSAYFNARAEVDGGGSINVGPGGATVLNPGSVLCIAGGSANLGHVDTATAMGELQFYGGAISLDGDLSLETGALFHESLTLYSTMALTQTNPTNTFTVAPLASLCIQGGSFTTGNLVVNGDIFWQGGTVNLTGPAGLTVGAGGPFGPGLRLEGDSILNVSAQTTVDAGSTLCLDGGRLSTNSLLVNGSVALDSSTATLNVSAQTTVNAGSTLSLGDGHLSTGSLLVNGSVVFDSPASTIAVATNFDVEPTGSFSVTPGATANVAAPGVNRGEILMGMGFIGGATISGAGSLTNYGLIHGSGRFTKPVNNASGGEVRAEADADLRFLGAAFANHGTIGLQSGTAEFLQGLTNCSDGLIMGRGTLKTAGTGMLNQGNAAFSGGFTDVYGDVTNAPGARIVISGGGTTTFYDDVNNSGEIRVSAGSAAVFFGTLNSGTTGTGTVYIEGDLTPGHSPATVSFDGDLFMGGGATLIAELGGTTPGTGYDVVDIGGLLALGGTLDVDLIYGFRPQPGQTFDILDFEPAALSGQFDTIALPDLGGGLSWDTSNLYTTGAIGVVPEPATLGLLALGGLVALRRRQ